jgi:hypothetical protein
VETLLQYKEMREVGMKLDEIGLILNKDEDGWKLKGKSTWDKIELMHQYKEKLQSKQKVIEHIISVIEEEIVSCHKHSATVSENLYKC